VYRGVQDLHAAIRYMYEFHDVYNIDTNYTFVGGSSAGSVATLHLAYLDQGQAPSSVYGNLVSPDLGSIESTGNSFNHQVELTGIVNLWGALGDSTYIDSDETVPSLHIHGVADGVVPFGVGAPFGAPTLNPTHGSRAIHNQLDLLGIEHKFHPFEGQDHEFHGADNGTFNNPPNAYWDTIFNLVDKHYLELVLPQPSEVGGDTVICVNGVGEYMVDAEANETPCWNVVGGQVVQGAGTSSVLIQWDEMATNGTVSCSIENEIGAVSRIEELNVEFVELPELGELEFLMSGNLALFSTVGGEEVEWDFGDGSISFGSSVSHIYEESGIYDVSASFQNDFGCVVKLDSAFYINKTIEQFLLYPNPASDVLIVSQSYNELGQLSIFSLSGKELLNQTIENTETQIDVSSFAAGVYLVYLENSKGTYFKKLAIQ
ncbi:MAG: T9SS type A sorting domain-containing protein, partial [Crocinitomicaceae bacterium]